MSLLFLLLQREIEVCCNGERNKCSGLSMRYSNAAVPCSGSAVILAKGLFLARVNCFSDGCRLYPFECSAAQKWLIKLCFQPSRKLESFRNTHCSSSTLLFTFHFPLTNPLPCNVATQPVLSLTAQSPQI